MCDYGTSMQCWSTSNPAFISVYAVSLAVMAGVASEWGDAESSGAPGLIMDLQGLTIVHRGTPTINVFGIVVRHYFLHAKGYSLFKCLSPLSFM